MNLTNSFRSFAILLPNGGVITEKTKINSKQLSTVNDLVLLIRSQWRKETGCKNFQQWADECNADENFDGGFTKDSALDNLCILFTLNIDGKHIELYPLFIELGINNAAAAIKKLDGGN